MGIVQLDGGAASIRVLTAALAEALDGGPTVFPVGPDTAAPPAITTDAALVVTTSGSTGRPKRVALSAAALRASADATAKRIGGPGQWLLASPALYIGGLQVLIRSLLAGTEPEILDLSNGFRPDAFAAAARRVHTGTGPHYTALVPTQLARILDAGPAALEAAKAFDAILIGGAATPPDLRKRAADAGVPIVRTYGMSETAGGCVYDGVPLDGVDVRTTGGRVEIGGATLATGYLQDDGSIDELPGEDGWFATDDLGTVDENGVLTISGRADSVINTGGVKVAAHAVEDALTSHPGVRAACVVGVPDEQWGEAVAALVVAEPGATPSERALTTTVRERLGAPSTPKIIHIVDELPLRGPGKTDRRAARELLRHNSSDVRL